MLGLASLVSSCGYIERDFIGKWKVTNVELDSQWRRNNISDEEMRGFKTMRYEFLEDGKMIYTEFGREIAGNWKLVRDEYLEVKYEYSDGYWNYAKGDLSFKVISCTGGKLTVSVKFNEDETWILYLEEMD